MMIKTTQFFFISLLVFISLAHAFAEENKEAPAVVAVTNTPPPNYFKSVSRIQYRMAINGESGFSQGTFLILPKGFTLAEMVELLTKTHDKNVVNFSNFDMEIKLARYLYPENDWGRAFGWVIRGQSVTDVPFTVSAGIQWNISETPGIKATTVKVPWKSLLQVKEYILSGDVYQVNFTHRFHVELSQGRSWELYKNLMRINPAPFACYLNFSEICVVSSSPERFLRVTGKHVETRPIKGTIRRGKLPDEDLKLKEALLSSIKDKAELAMIVDLMRNDIGRVISCSQNDEYRAKFLKKIVSSFSRPIYYADYREKYCDIPVYDVCDIPESSLLGNFIAIGTEDDLFMKNLFMHEIPARILGDIYKEIPREEIIGLIVKIPNSYAPQRRTLLISIADCNGMAKYKNEDVFRAKFNPPFTGKRDLMRHDAVIFTDAGVRKINFGLDWGIAETFTL